LIEFCDKIGRIYKCIGLLKHYEVKLYICLVVLLLLVVPKVKQSSCWSFQPYLWQNADCICRCL